MYPKNIPYSFENKIAAGCGAGEELQEVAVDGTVSLMAFLTPLLRHSNFEAIVAAPGCLDALQAVLLGVVLPATAGVGCVSQEAHALAVRCVGQFAMIDVLHQGITPRHTQSVWSAGVLQFHHLFVLAKVSDTSPRKKVVFIARSSVCRIELSREL